MDITRGEAIMEIRIVDGIDKIDAHVWDSFVSADDPFGNHAFLHALENSKSVDKSTGWIPCHIELSDNGNIVGLAPMYLKMHSYGEYIFDWGWADAYERAGGKYYPKLQSAVPFTPVTGRRLLVKNRAPEEYYKFLVSTIESLDHSRKLPLDQSFYSGIFQDINKATRNIRIVFLPIRIWGIERMSNLMTHQKVVYGRRSTFPQRKGKYPPMNVKGRSGDGSVLNDKIFSCKELCKLSFNFVIDH